MSDETSGSDSKQDFSKEVDALVEGAAGLFSNLKEIFEKSRDEIARASRLGKTRLDLLQLEKDREHFLQQLGAEAQRLIKAGEINDEAALALSVKIDALDEKKAAYEAEVAKVAEEQAAAEAAANDAGAEDAGGDEADEGADAADDGDEPAAKEPAPKAKKKGSKKKAKKDL